MKNAIKWAAGFFEDQGNRASSKRMALYVMLLFLYTIIHYVATTGKAWPDLMVLYSVVGIILALIGVVGAEFFKAAPFGGKDENQGKP